MPGLLARRRGQLDEAERAALRDVLADPIFELLPLKSLPDQVPHLPPGARVSVTASPAKGIDATVDWAARLQADGFRAIPHLSARMVADRGVLAGLLDRAREAGLTHAFVVGGDADEPGAYLDGLSLLRAMTELGHPFTTIGCPAYPQGHPDIPDAALAEALRDKAPFVTTSRPRWTSTRRRSSAGCGPAGAEGFEPDVVVGRAGRGRSAEAAVDRGADRRQGREAVPRQEPALRDRDGAVGRVLQADPARRGPRAAGRGRVARVTGLHLYTFNAVEATEAWRRSEIETLA